jgi:hypothetical protein
MTGPGNFKYLWLDLTARNAKTEEGGPMGEKDASKMIAEKAKGYFDQGFN